MAASIRDRIARHAEAAYPDEACGALFALRTGRSLPVVTGALPLLNRASLPRKAFRVDPGELAVPGFWQITIPVIGGRSGARRAWRREGAVVCRN